MDRYVGFSSLEFQNNKSFVLRNVNLIKQDLLNNIFTRPYERVMMCAWGTRIPDLISDPLDETSLYIIQQDITTVFENDPRVQLLELDVVPLYDQGTVMVFTTVAYTYLNFSGSFDISIQFIDTGD
jgi:phage baseplate assembly protein W